jgi:hypothetical protein
MPKSKAKRICQLPKAITIKGRSSSITNAFINAILPVREPSPEEEIEALAQLGMTPATIRCVYCGDKHTEWDHLRPIIYGKGPTGYITEIANLVPACGKCNQSKGNKKWDKWIVSGARLSPQSRVKTEADEADLKERISRLQAYANWNTPVPLAFASIAGSILWDEHLANQQSVLELLDKSQKHARKIRDAIKPHSDSV